MAEFEVLCELAPSPKRGKADMDNGQKLKQKVEEFKLWTDDKQFQQLEYEKRRERKKERKGIIRNDKLLKRSNFCYFPAFLVILTGAGLILMTTVDGLVMDTAVLGNKTPFQIAGGVLLSVGLLLLMGVAVYTYRREDAVRAENGFPSLFNAARTRKPSLKNMEDSFTFTCDFVERENSKGRLSRLASAESSKASLSNLGWSFSSNSTAMSWLQKHKSEHVKVTQTSLRRQNSDSALDTYFARNRILSWRKQTSMPEKDSDRAEEKEDGGESRDHNHKKRIEGITDTQVYSSISTTSSGYDSGIASPIPNTLKPPCTHSRNFARSVSDQSGDSGAQQIAQQIATTTPHMLEPTFTHSRNFDKSLSDQCGDGDNGAQQISSPMLRKLEPTFTHFRNFARSVSDQSGDNGAQQIALTEFLCTSRNADDCQDCQAPVVPLIPTINIVRIESLVDFPN